LSSILESRLIEAKRKFEPSPASNPRYEMRLPVLLTLALVLGSADPLLAGTAASSAAADTHPAPYGKFASYDAKAEQRLLQLTNSERQKAGAPALEFDSGLSAAARQHAAAMAARGELSHQFAGEAPLQERLAKSALHLDKAGENVALDVDIDQAHDGLMHSQHHRENLLRPDYNVVGLAVARVGDRLYVVEDFGHSIPTYEARKAEDMVSSAIVQATGNAQPARFKRLELSSLRDAACSMAMSDKLNPKLVGGVSPLRYVLTYTSMQPDQLAPAAAKAIVDNNPRSYAVGACFAHTPTYPNGAYFVTVAFY
jgi:uncharacterized protein YkwD